MDLLSERGLINPEGAHSMDLPVAKVMEVITSSNPLTYSGKIVRTIQ